MAVLSHRRVLTGFALLSVVTGCGLREIDPPPKPPQTMPVVEEPKAGPGPHEGRLFIDAVGGPAQVDEVIGITAGFEENTTRGHQTELTTRPVCAQTPCVIDMHAGYHILRYSRPGDDYSKTSLTTAEVGEYRSVISHDLGYYQTHKTRAAVGGGMQTIGIVTAALGVPFLLAGIFPLDDLLSSQKTVKEVQDGLQTAGLAMMVTGASLLIVGEVVKIFSRTEYQKGSTTQWTLPPRNQPPPPPVRPPQPEEPRVISKPIEATPPTPPTPPPAPPPVMPDAGATPLAN